MKKKMENQMSKVFRAKLIDQPSEKQFVFQVKPRWFSAWYNEHTFRYHRYGNHDKLLVREEATKYIEQFMEEDFEIWNSKE